MGYISWASISVWRNMACQQLISHVRASGQYVGNLAAELQEKAMHGQISAVKTYLEKIAGPEEALQASEAIQEHFGAYMTASQRRDIQGLLNDAACKLPLVLAGKAGALAGTLQHWQDTFWRDVPKDLLEALGDKSLLATARMQQVFKYVADRGLRVPGEKMFVSMLSLFFYADGCPAGITATTLLSAVQHVKDSWKVYIQEYKRCIENADSASWSWPGPPRGVVCVRVDFIRFMNIYNQIPCRNSHGSVQQRGKQPLAVFGSSSLCRSPSLDMIGADAGGPLAIDFPGHRGIAAGARVGGGADLVVRPNGGEGLLALPAPAAELGLHDPAAPAIQTAVAAPAIQTAAPAALILPAPARKSLAAVADQLRADSARRGAAKAAKDKEKRNQKKKAAGKKKTAGKKRAADTDAAEEKTVGKKKKTAGKKRAADDAAEEKTVGKKKTAGQKKKQFSKKRLLLKKRAKASETLLVGVVAPDPEEDVAVCKECGSSEGVEVVDWLQNGNLEEICVWCAEAQENTICKKPAATGKVFKKPAMAPKPKTGPIPSATEREANRKASIRDKKVFFMKWGCTKCRWHAGCTKSCWSGRNMEQPEDVN